MLIIGESLNAAIPSIGKAIAERDIQTITSLAHQQAACGAQMLDVNAGGLPGRDETADLVWLVQAVQSTVEMPLVLDSNNPEALYAAAEFCQDPRTLLSSANGEPGRLEKLLPLAIRRGWGLVALCMDQNGIPPAAEGRLEIATAMIEKSLAAGMSPESLYIDPLVMTIGAEYQSGKVTLDTLQRIHQRFPTVKTICGVSNIGFGLPLRRLFNRTFSAMLVYQDLDAFIVDVRDHELLNVLLAGQAVAGKDPFCRQYLKAYRKGLLEQK